VTWLEALLVAALAAHCARADPSPASLTALLMALSPAVHFSA
jgi:hypothetical protein